MGPRVSDHRFIATEPLFFTVSLAGYTTRMNSTPLPPNGHPFIPAPDAPTWFVENLRQPGTSRYAILNGSPVHFLTWNWEREELPTLLFVHGFCGHARWWSFLMPFFTDRYRVAAIDLPGMGDSGPQPEYNDECFARGILAVVEQYRIEHPTLIGHSFGGGQSIRAMGLAPDLFRHGIVVDSLVRFPPEERPRLIDGKPTHKLRPTQADCLERFRLSPPQPELIPSLFDYVAHHSCTGNDQGWHWKFDPRIRNFGEISGTALQQKVRARVDCIYGGLSMFTPDDRPRRILASFPRHGELVIVPRAHHHLMLDHPLELVDAVRKLLAV